MNTLMGMNLMRVEDIGEGRQKIILYKPDLLFQFVEWYNELLFKKDSEKVIVKEEEIKILNGVLHFAKKQPKDDKGLVKLSLTSLQNESMKELGFFIKLEETLPLIEKKLMGDQIMEEGGGISSVVQVEELEKITPFWSIIYALKKVTR